MRYRHIGNELLNLYFSKYAFYYGIRKRKRDGMEYLRLSSKEVLK